MVEQSVELFRVFGLLLGLAAAEQLRQAVPDAAQEERAEQVLERHERVVDAQQDGRQLEVDQEDDDAEVDQRVRRGDQVGLLVQHENDGRDHRGLCVAANERQKYG